MLNFLCKLCPGTALFLVPFWICALILPALAQPNSVPVWYGVDQLQALETAEQPIHFRIQAGQVLPVSFRLSGRVVHAEAQLLLKFDQDVLMLIDGEHEPLFSRDGEQWQTGARLFGGSIGLGLDKQGVDVQLKIENR